MRSQRWEKHSAARRVQELNHRHALPKNEHNINHKTVVITANPDNMKLVGVPKNWVKHRKCDPSIVDENFMTNEII